jgi:hypothetical protein
VSIDGLMKGFIRVNGLIIIWRAMDFINGLMVKNTWVNLKKIKKMVMEYTLGVMEEFIVVSGKKVNSMDSEIMKYLKKIENKMVCGKMGRGFYG